jgi:hypothetical protein
MVAQDVQEQQEDCLAPKDKAVILCGQIGSDGLFDAKKEEGYTTSSRSSSITSMLLLGLLAAAGERGGDGTTVKMTRK